MYVYSKSIIRYKEYFLSENKNHIERKKNKIIIFYSRDKRKYQKKIIYDEKKFLITNLYVSVIEW
jgi:hypothetical protein